MKSFLKIICLVAFLGVTSAYAQNGSLYTVKLKSGLVLKCELIRMVPDSFVVIRQYDQLTSIQYTEVESIEYAGSKTTGTNMTSGTPMALRRVLQALPDTGWTFGFQMGTGICLDADLWEDLGLTFRFCGLKGINKRMEAGFNVGIDPYVDWGMIFLAVQGDLRCYFREQRPRSGFLYAQAGYGTILTGYNVGGGSGGINWAIGLGSASRTSQNDVFSFSAGLHMQTFREQWNNSFFDGTTWRSSTFSRNNFLAGIETKLEWRF